MKLQDLWRFVTSIPHFEVGLYLLVVLLLTRFLGRNIFASTVGEETPRPSIAQLALLLGVFFLFVIALLSALWAFTHFITCKQPQCTIIFLAAVVILFGIFLALAVPFSNTLAQLEITITKKTKIGARGLSLCLIVVGFGGLLAVGYLFPCK